ncbi:transposable element Tc1 transposase [Trichonephila clavipes]|nr:transposable element Tc1 transposase [Trichonephila clavipes]
MRGTLTGQHYVDDILRPYVGPFLKGPPGAIFQQNNARPLTARVAQDFLHHFQTLPWPTHSPDLSPVEPVWDQLKRQMPSRHSVHDLELAVQELGVYLGTHGTWILGNPYLPLLQAATPFTSGLRHHQLVPEQHSPQGACARVVFATAFAMELHFACQQSGSRIDRYTNAEPADMILAFWSVNCNGRVAQRLYTRRYPG